MKIKLEDLKNSLEQQQTFIFDEKIEDIDSNGNIKADVTITKTGYGVDVKAKVAVELNCTCGRCLKQYIQPLKFNIDEKYIESDMFDEGQTECMLTDFAEELKGREELDLTDLIYQCIILNTPTTSLCNNDCEGTQELKKLEENRTDPRLNVFKNIKIDRK